MFEDFEAESESSEDKKRRATSALASTLVFGAIAAAGIAAAAVTTQIVRQPEPEAEVVFEELPPENEPPPPPRREMPPPPRNNRPAAAVVRQQMDAPTEIPNEVPEESDGALSEAGDVGPLDGELGGTGDGDVNGTGTVETPEPAEDESARLAAIPQYVHADIELPRHIGGCVRPDYPQEARSHGVTDRVVVRVRVREDGTIAGIEFVQGDTVFHENVRRCLETGRWEPARLADGTAISYARTVTFPFRLSNI